METWGQAQVYLAENRLWLQNANHSDGKGIVEHSGGSQSHEITLKINLKMYSKPGYKQNVLGFWSIEKKHYDIKLRLIFSFHVIFILFIYIFFSLLAWLYSSLELCKGPIILFILINVTNKITFHLKQAFSLALSDVRTYSNINNNNNNY